MKVCLINPPLCMKTPPIQVYYPTGLLYVASYLRENGYKVKIIDAPATNYQNIKQIDGFWFRGLSFTDIIKRLNGFNPDIIGITINFSMNANSAYRLAKRIKTEFDILIIMGGHHASVKPGECVNYADYVVAGEGELATLNLLKRLESDNKPDKTIIRNDKPITDLDGLPAPARDLIPMQNYFNSAKTSLIHGITGLNRWVSLVTSRGCPYNCNFCAIHLTMGRKWRARSVNNVIAEIDNLVSEYSITDVVIEDDNMAFDNERMNRICNEIINRNYNLNFYVPNGVRADTLLDTNLLTKMKQAGFKEIWISPESGNQRVVNEIIGKRLNLKHVEDVVRKGTTIGLKISCFFVIGSPGETITEINDTIKFAKKLKQLGMHRFAWGYATPYYGTKLYEICKQNNYLIKEFDNNSVTPSNPSIITPNLTLEKLKNVRNAFRV